MNFQEKARAMQALDDDFSIRLDINNRWYVQAHVEVGGNGFLEGRTGRGVTPEVAIENTWKEWTELPPDRYLVLYAGRDTRRHVRWNGFMWEDVRL